MFYFLLLLLVILIAVGGYLWSQGQLGGQSGLFGGGQYQRINLVESTTIKGGRKLLLIRRDDVEHLVMTGGPVDVVVETGIIARPATENPQATRNGRADPLFVPPETAPRHPAQPGPNMRRS